ncbi:MAG: MFS transporter, partial [Pseudomonadales bacterium]
RLRPYILFGALPLGVISILTFTTPDLNASGKLWWAYITYIAFGIAYTVVGIPYSAMTASLTTHHQERTVLSTIRMGFAFGGGYVISVGMLPLVGLFETPQAGFRWALIIFSVVATALLCLTFASAVFDCAKTASVAHTNGTSLSACARDRLIITSLDRLS